MKIKMVIDHALIVNHHWEIFVSYEFNISEIITSEIRDSRLF